MNGLKIAWGKSSDGTQGEITLRTINLPITFSQKPVVCIHPTGIDDTGTNGLVVNWGNSYYGTISAISTTNFTYRGYKINWIAIGY